MTYAKKIKIKKKTHTAYNRRVDAATTLLRWRRRRRRTVSANAFTFTRSHRTDADDWTAGKRDGSPEVAQCDRDVRSQTTGARDMIEFSVRSRRRDSMIREFMYDSNAPKNRRKNGNKRPKKISQRKYQKINFFFLFCILK